MQLSSRGLLAAAAWLSVATADEPRVWTVFWCAHPLASPSSRVRAA